MRLPCGHVEQAAYMRRANLDGRTLFATEQQMDACVTTNCYRLDESLIAGKNGGEPLDPARSQAFFALSLSLDMHKNTPVGVDIAVVHPGHNKWRSWTTAHMLI